jgi:hypothetical protein
MPLAGRVAQAFEFAYASENGVPHPRVFCEGGHDAADSRLVLNSP